MSGDSLHDLLVFGRVAVTIIDAADAAIRVVQDPVHGLAPKAERRHRRAEGAPEVVRRGPLESDRLQISRMGRSRPEIGLPRAVANTKPEFGPAVQN